MVEYRVAGAAGGVDVQATLEALFDAAVDGMITIDPKGNIGLFNRSAECIFGYCATEVQGRNVSVLMPESHAKQHDAYISRFARTGQAKIIGIGRAVEGLRADGTVFPMELSVGEIVNTTGTQGFIGIVRDISARVQAEEDARINREQLAHVTRLNSMGEMAAGIAHEVNQPLSAIASYAQACRNLLNSPSVKLDKVQSILAKIDAQALRASAVIGRLRRFVRHSDSAFVAVQLHELIEDTLALAKTDTRLLDCPVMLTVEPEIGPVLADAVQVQQVLLNLIRNGVDAMMADQHCLEKKLQIRIGHRNKETVVVDVRDFGHGLSQEAVNKLFHPFFTTKSQGMGIGLCVSRSIIRSHGGELWFEQPDDGEGARFCFTLVQYE